MRKVIYTAITSGYDKLKEPLIITPGWDYICYTNNKDLKSKVWKIILVNLNCIKDVRKIKIIQPFESDISLWIDGSIDINCNLNEFIKNNHKSSFSVMKHPDRNCVYEEAKACIRLKKDNEDIINNQVSTYKEEGYPHNNGMVATGLIIRSNNEVVKEFCKCWWSEVEKYSRRDQLSFNYILNKFKIPINLLNFSILKREFQLTRHNKKK